MQCSCLKRRLTSFYTKHYNTLTELPPLSDSDFISCIQRILASDQTATKRTEQPSFSFEMTDEAATINTAILAAHNFDFHDAICSQINSPVGFGSEFRSPDILEPLLCRHPLWHFLKPILANGAELPRTSSTDLASLYPPLACLTSKMLHSPPWASNSNEL